MSTYNKRKMGKEEHRNEINNNNNSQCGFHFRGVWGDPAVGNLTPTSISAHREVDSLRPTKLYFVERNKHHI